MKCYYHESSEVMGQCPSCSKFLCKVCLDEYGTNFCTDCTVKKYNQFCEEFKEKLNKKIQWQKEKIGIAEGAWKKMKFRAILLSITVAPFMMIFMVSFFILLNLILYWIIPRNDITVWITNIGFILGALLSLALPVYLTITGVIADAGARLHRELKEKERTENKIIDFSPEMQAIFTELRLVATSVSPFGRDQIYEEPGESNVYFARLKRSLVLQFSAFSAPSVYRKIKETRKQLADGLEKLQQITAPPLEKFVSVQRTLLAEQKQKPVLPDV